MTQTLSAIDGEAPPRRYDWSVEQYHRIGELGLFSAEARLELVNGEVYEHVSPIGAPHSTAAENTADALRLLVRPGMRVLQERPLQISGDTEVQPDIIVVHDDRARFAIRHPEPRDVTLLVEISDTTLSYDRGRKLAIYAAAGIAEYWIVNLADRRLEVYRDPVAGTGYRITLLALSGQSMAPLFAPENSVAVNDILDQIL